MRKLLLVLMLSISTLSAGSVGFELPLENISGISLGYSYRPFYLFGTKTDVVSYPTHMLFLNIDGLMNSAGDSDVKFFGGLGVIAGVAAQKDYAQINPKFGYYSDYYRLTSLKRKTGDMMLIGGDVRIMIELPFCADYSIIESYFCISLEAAYMKMNYLAEAGGFNKYVSKKITEGGGYYGLNLGLKIFLVEVYGGVGFLNGLYSKGIDLTSEVDDKKDENLSNPPETTNHFVAHVGVGFVIDLHRME